jgi:hypothetical protein
MRGIAARAKISSKQSILGGFYAFWTIFWPKTPPKSVFLPFEAILAEKSRFLRH